MAHYWWFEGYVLIVQRLVAKYGLAAHLAFVAVAPLFLFPFFDERAIGTVVICLSALSVVWIFIEPSLRGGEMPHNARIRVAKSIFKDPIFWIMLVVVLLSWLRFANDGVAMKYDAENAVWFLAKPKFPLLPGTVAGVGKMSVAAAFAALVLVEGCRHAMGRSARSVFLLLTSALAGLAATIAVVSVRQGCVCALDAARGAGSLISYVGVAFAIYAVCALVALVDAFERKWNVVMPLFMLAIGGTTAGMFAFSSSLLIVVFAAIELLMLLYVFVFAKMSLPKAVEFKMLVIFGVSVTMGVLLTMLLPADIVNSRITAIAKQDFFLGSSKELSEMLSAISLKAWTSHLWNGTGLGSFLLDVRFNATQADWAILSKTPAVVSNCMWYVLVERGIVGAVMIVAPIVLLLLYYVKHLIVGMQVGELPRPACWIGPLALIVTLATAAFECSLLRAEVLMAIFALLALSANTFSKGRKR